MNEGSVRWGALQLPFPRTATERLIFPLDVDSFEQAAPLIAQLKDHVGLFKVGLALMMREGPQVIERVAGLSGAPVFVDLKFYDIPNTVRQAVRVLTASHKQVRFITVHTGDGEAIVRAAVDGVQGAVGVLGVTLLTSLPPGAVGSRANRVTVVELAQLAKRAGCAGVVCSGREVGGVKQACGHDFLVVTPGIRPVWATINGDDQQRAVTPEEAVACGADYLVIGRPIATADKPAEAAMRIAREIEAAQSR